MAQAMADRRSGRRRSPGGAAALGTALTLSLRSQSLRRFRFVIGSDIKGLLWWQR